MAAIGFVGSGMAHYALAIGMDTAQGKPGRRAGIHRRGRRGGLPAWPGGEFAGSHRCHLLLCHRHAGFLAPAVRQVPRTRPALHRRAGLLQAYHRGRQSMLDATGTTPQDYQYAVFHQPNTKFPQRVAEMLGFHERADRPRPARPGDRQHLCRGGHHRPDRHPGYRRARRPHLDGLLRLGRRLGCFCPSPSPRRSASAATAPHTPRIISPGAPRSITPPMPATAASCR